MTVIHWREAATASELAPIFRERDDAFRADLRDDVRAGIADGTILPDCSTLSLWRPSRAPTRARSGHGIQESAGLE